MQQPHPMLLDISPTSPLNVCPRPSYPSQLIKQLSQTDATASSYAALLGQMDFAILSIGESGVLESDNNRRAQSSWLWASIEHV
jgi:hypothetical protein